MKHHHIVPTFGHFQINCHGNVYLKTQYDLIYHDCWQENISMVCLLNMTTLVLEKSIAHI